MSEWGDMDAPPFTPEQIARIDAAIARTRAGQPPPEWFKPILEWAEQYLAEEREFERWFWGF